MHARRCSRAILEIHDCDVMLSLTNFCMCRVRSKTSAHLLFYIISYKCDKSTCYTNVTSANKCSSVCVVAIDVDATRCWCLVSTCRTFTCCTCMDSCQRFHARLARCIYVTHSDSDLTTSRLSSFIYVRAHSIYSSHL